MQLRAYRLLTVDMRNCCKWHFLALECTFCYIIGLTQHFSCLCCSLSSTAPDDFFLYWPTASKFTCRVTLSNFFSFFFLQTIVTHLWLYDFRWSQMLEVWALVHTLKSQIVQLAPKDFTGTFTGTTPDNWRVKLFLFFIFYLFWYHRQFAVLLFS